MTNVLKFRCRDKGYNFKKRYKYGLYNQVSNKKDSAEFLDEKLKNEKVTAIITSPYLRCKHTAEIMNKYHDLKIVEDDRFN